MDPTPVNIQVSVPSPDAPFCWKYTNLTANGSFVLKEGPGKLHAVTLNTSGRSANVLAVFDNVVPSGSRIATIDVCVTAGGALSYDVAFEKGLCVSLLYGEPADLTVSWA